jgi:hypothetical protein
MMAGELQWMQARPFFWQASLWTAANPHQGQRRVRINTFSLLVVFFLSCWEIAGWYLPFEAAEPV